MIAFIEILFHLYFILCKNTMEWLVFNIFDRSERAKSSKEFAKPWPLINFGKIY